jgi:hypothetical protein
MAVTNFGELCENHRETVAELVRQHGLEPNDISADFTVLHEGGRSFLLLDEYLRDGAGRIVTDGFRPMVTKSHRIEVAPESLPGPLRLITP